MLYENRICIFSSVVLIIIKIKGCIYSSNVANSRTLTGKKCNMVGRAFFVEHRTGSTHALMRLASWESSPWKLLNELFELWIILGILHDDIIGKFIDYWLLNACLRYALKNIDNVHKPFYMYNSGLILCSFWSVYCIKLYISHLPILY